jgi:hypothetical protein
MSAYLAALAFKSTEFALMHHVALVWGLSALLRAEELAEFEKLLDPGNSSGPPGDEWAFLCRRFRYGEFAIAAKAKLELDLKYGSPLTRERALERLKHPMPSASENPHSTWPVGTRFKALFLDESAEIEALGARAEFPEMYYDAPTFQQITRLLMAAHAKQYPDAEVDARARILAHATWWVDHDAAEPPGSKPGT